IYPLSLHDALPICKAVRVIARREDEKQPGPAEHPPALGSSGVRFALNQNYEIALIFCFYVSALLSPFSTAFSSSLWASACALPAVVVTYSFPVDLRWGQHNVERHLLLYAVHVENRFPPSRPCRPGPQFSFATPSLDV